MLYGLATNAFEKVKAVMSKHHRNMHVGPISDCGETLKNKAIVVMFYAIWCRGSLVNKLDVPSSSL